MKGVQQTLGNFEKSKKQQRKTVRFIKAVPSFVDLDLKVLGPFEPGDILTTHIDIANLLILKGRAKEFDID